MIGNGIVKCGINWKNCDDKETVRDISEENRDRKSSSVIRFTLHESTCCVSACPFTSPNPLPSSTSLLDEASR